MGTWDDWSNDAGNDKLRRRRQNVVAQLRDAWVSGAKIPEDWKSRDISEIERWAQKFPVVRGKFFALELDIRKEFSDFESAEQLFDRMHEGSRADQYKARDEWNRRYKRKAKKKEDAMNAFKSRANGLAFETRAMKLDRVFRDPSSTFRRGTRAVWKLIRK